MAKKYFELSPELQEKIKDEATEEQIKSIYSSFHKYNLIDYAYRYVLSWLKDDKNYMNSVRLHIWLKTQLNNPIIEQIAAECISNTHDRTMKNILKYWRHGGIGKVYYETDKTTYGVGEHWADIEEILKLRKTDCEGFMLLCFLTAIAAGVPEYRLYCTIGNVVGGGHAYLTYIADDLVMHVVDGCYWTDACFKVPYFDNRNYYNGTKEWARFNTQGTFLLKG